MTKSNLAEYKMIQMNQEIKRICYKILYEYALLDELKKIGVPHIIGSYRMDDGEQ